MSGKIIPKEKDIQKIEYKKAIVTIELLNLNHPRLCNIRKNFIKECLCSFDCVKYYDNFPTLKTQIITDYNL